MSIKTTATILLIYALAVNTITAGITISKSNGISVTGVDGVTISGTDGVTVSGADGILSYSANGITVSGTDGVSVSGADGAAYTSPNGVTVSGADGVTVSGADGITISGTDGVTVTGADGTVYHADSIVVKAADGVTVSGADGVTISGTDGVTVTGTDGVTVSGADGVTISGADGTTISGADSISGFGLNGMLFELISPAGVTVSGADGISITGADGITVSGAEEITVFGVQDDDDTGVGLQSIDGEFALALNEVSDDSNLNAIIVFHSIPTEADLQDLRTVGILGGTRFKHLPFIYVTATRSQIITVSRFSNVRSIYGNRTLDLNSDPYFQSTQIERVEADGELQYRNSGLPVSGRNVTVAVLDTGVNSLHSDLVGKVVQNVRLGDVQSAPAGFVTPVNIENLANTDPVSGHGTFVAGVIAGNGLASGGKYDGVAPGAGILGLSAGDLNLTHVLSGFDYLLENGGSYNVRAVNCSFSANAVYDPNDPVNIATKLLTQNGISVIFSAGNSGPGEATLNPYAAAPWVVSVGATDERRRLAQFSSRGVFGDSAIMPSLVAPGVNVISLRNTVSQTGILGIAGGGDSSRLKISELPYYTSASGTSFSAPQVTGAIALMLEANPNLSPSEIKEILQRSSTPLVSYYGHEVGAGMLNTYAAVLEAAFPNRRTGLFRSTLGISRVTFDTDTILDLRGTASPGFPFVSDIFLPPNTVRSNFSIYWGGLLSANDLGLKIFSSNNDLLGQSNNLNLPGLTGRREKVVLVDPGSQTVRVRVSNTLAVGTTQEFVGSAVVTTVAYPKVSDLVLLSPSDKSSVLECLRSFQMTSWGSKFRPYNSVSREELALALVQSGFVTQFIAAQPMYQDVRNLSSRNSVESAQGNPSGKLFYDAETGNKFRPGSGASKLVTAVALVRAAGLEGAAGSAILSPAITDSMSIPVHLRGYVAVAIQKGLLKTDGNAFNPGRTIKRIELANALVVLKRLSG